MQDNFTLQDTAMRAQIFAIVCRGLMFLAFAGLAAAATLCILLGAAT